MKKFYFSLLALLATNFHVFGSVDKDHFTKIDIEKIESELKSKKDLQGVILMENENPFLKEPMSRTIFINWERDTDHVYVWFKIISSKGNQLTSFYWATKSSNVWETNFPDTDLSTLIGNLEGKDEKKISWLNIPEVNEEFSKWKKSTILYIDPLTEERKRELKRAEKREFFWKKLLDK